MQSPRLQQLLNFLEGLPEDSFITFAIAKEYESLNERDKALEFYLKLEQNDPEYVGLYYHLGKLYEKFGRYQTARKTYQKGMDIAKKQKDTHAYNELSGAKGYLEEEE